MINNINTQIKNTKHLFKTLNISKKTLTKKQKKSLNQKGFIIFPPNEFIKNNLKILNKITNKLIKTEGRKGGWEGKEKYYKKGKQLEVGADRLGNLVDKHKIFRDILLRPEILAAAFEVIKTDIKISGFNFRNPRKGYGKQGLHIDWIPRKKRSEPFSGVVCFTYLNNSNFKNGAVRIVPGSHKIIGWPDEHINTSANHKKEIRLTARAGTTVVMNLNVWHGGATNINGKPRKTIFLQIKRRDQPQLINYKKYLSKKTKNNLNELQKYLLAVRNCDKTQKEDSVGPGILYRKKFSKDRTSLK